MVPPGTVGTGPLPPFSAVAPPRSPPRQSRGRNPHEGEELVQIGPESFGHLGGEEVGVVMRRSLPVFLLALVIWGALVGGQARPARAALNVFIDGRAVPGSLVTLHAARLYASVHLLEHYQLITSRRVGEALEVQAGGGLLSAVPGEPTGVVNGRQTTLEAPLVLIDGAVHIPLRMLADVAGWRVHFDARTGRLDLVSRRGAVNDPAEDGEPPSPAGFPGGAAADADAQNAHDELLAELAIGESGLDVSSQEEAADGDDEGTLSEAMAQRAEAWNFEERRKALEERRRRLAERLTAGTSQAAEDDVASVEASSSQDVVQRHADASPDDSALTDWPELEEATASEATPLGDGAVASMPEPHHAPERALEPIPEGPVPAGPVPEGRLPEREFLAQADRQWGGASKPVSAAAVPAESAAGTGVAESAGESVPPLSPPPRPAFAGDRTVVYAVTVDQENGRQRVVIHADGPLQFESHLLAGPSRLVVDLLQAVWVGEPQRSVHPGPVVRRIRAGQYDPERTRIVVDVDAPVRFQAASTGAGLVLTLHQQVGPVRVWSGPTGPIIDISASGPLEPVISTLPEPHRLVVDLPGASLVTEAREGEGPGPVIGRWRVSQFDPDTVRLVVELDRPFTVRASQFYPAEPDAPAGAGAPGYGGVHRLSLGSTMKGIGMERIGSGWALLVEGESPLQAHISRLFEPHRIFVDLPGALLPEEWEPLTWSGEHGVERVRVGRNRPDLVRVVVDTSAPMGFQVFRSPDEERIVVFMRPSTLAGKKIVLDPGHGGHDSGAIGVTGLRESDVNLQLARLLANRLSAEGAHVIWTRNTDVYIPLADRPDVANRIGADVFISIHNNSCPEHCTGSGTETYFLPTRWENQLLAASIQHELVRAIGLEDRGIKQRNLAVLRHSEVPAVLVEVAFLSSPHEERLLRDRSFLERAADGLYRGVRRYMADVTSDSAPDFTEMDPQVAKAVTRLLAEGLAAAEYVMTTPSVPAEGPKAREAPSLAGSAAGEGEQS